MKRAQAGAVRGKRGEGSELAGVWPQMQVSTGELDRVISCHAGEGGREAREGKWAQIARMLGIFICCVNNVDF